MCIVPNLVGLTTSAAVDRWATNGFTTPISFNPPMTPSYKIGWQSLAAGSSQVCTVGISVSDVAP